jgi:hypothetical protein
MSTEHPLVGFSGGPYDDSVVHGLVARVIWGAFPPFMCVEADGRWEHYSAVDDCGSHDLCFEYAGPCHVRDPHEPCGHDHSTGP